MVNAVPDLKYFMFDTTYMYHCWPLNHQKLFHDETCIEFTAGRFIMFHGAYIVYSAGIVLKNTHTMIHMETLDHTTAVVCFIVHTLQLLYPCV